MQVHVDDRRSLLGQKRCSSLTHADHSNGCESEDKSSHRSLLLNQAVTDCPLSVPSVTRSASMNASGWSRGGSSAQFSITWSGHP
jgi:hypothetical protein